MGAAGLLLSAGSLVQRCTAGRAEPAAAHIGEIGIPSGGNEERLRRAVTTFARNGREHGREIAFAVATNCAPDRLGTVQALAAKWAAEEQVPVVVLGEEDKHSTPPARLRRGR